MNDRVRNISDMFVATREFDRVNAADYAGLPEAAAQFAIVDAAIAAIENFATEQVSGARAQAVEQKSVLRAAMRRKMTDMARTARALNFTDPGFRRLFRVPDNDNDQMLASTARVFVEEGNAHLADFERLGLMRSEIDALDADITAFENAINAEAEANTETVGATAGLDDQIEGGMQAETVLDAIMRNVYRNNPVKLAEWMSARHVRRAPRAKTDVPTP